MDTPDSGFPHPPEGPLPTPAWEPPPEPVEPPPATPLPWEDPLGHPAFWPRLGAMFTLLFSDPLAYGARVRAGEGLLRPWTFVLTLATPLFALMLLVLGFLSLLFGVLLRAEFKEMPVWLLPLVGLSALVLLPVFLFLQMAAWGLLNHLALWLWGGLRPGAGVEATLRLTGYALGFYTLGSLIPLVNYAVLVVVPVVLGMALARLHGTDTWRGICAAFTPVLFCCCLYAAWIGAMIVLIPKT